jgi:hypothetical protein
MGISFEKEGADSERREMGMWMLLVKKPIKDQLV